MKHLFAPAVLLLTVALTATAQTEPIRIDLGQKGAVVSPNLYGIFFEEISHAGDGGLYAELVQNRGFEEHVLPSGMTYKDGKAFAPDAMNYEHRNNRNWNIPWNLEEKKMTGWRVTGEKATVSGEVIEAPDPLHKNTPHAMQLTIKKVQKGGKAVLTNTGYWGIGLKQGEKYDLRCYVRSAGYNSLSNELDIGDIVLSTDCLGVAWMLPALAIRGELFLRWLILISRLLKNLLRLQRRQLLKC